MSSSELELTLPDDLSSRVLKGVSGYVDHRVYVLVVLKSGSLELVRTTLCAMAVALRS